MESNETNLKQPEAPKGKEKKKKSVGHEILSWIGSLVAAVLIVLVIQNFLFTLIRVDGTSMYDTLLDGERLFVTVTDVKLGHVSRGDVVICNYPNRTSKLFGFLPIETKTLFVKRVVGVPGDTVFRKNGINYVRYETTNADGESVIVDEALDANVYHIGADYDAYTLGDNEYFVVGDNRGNSHDSRDWNNWDNNPGNDVGPITGDMVVGHVRFVFWPLNSIRGVE